MRTPRNVSTRSCHCEHSRAGAVTAAALAARRAPAARVLPAARSGSDDDASCRSSSAGDATSWRGAVARAVMTRDPLSPSSQLLRVSSPVCAP